MNSYPWEKRKKANRGNTQNGIQVILQKYSKQFFKSHILEKGVNISKGSLPSKELITEFLSNYSIFENTLLSEEDKHSLVRVKVFNERKKARSKAQLLLSL